MRAPAVYCAASHTLSLTTNTPLTLSSRCKDGLLLVGSSRHSARAPLVQLPLRQGTPGSAATLPGHPWFSRHSARAPRVHVPTPLLHLLHDTGKGHVASSHAQALCMSASLAAGWLHFARQAPSSTAIPAPTCSMYASPSPVSWRSTILRKKSMLYTRSVAQGRGRLRHSSPLGTCACKTRREPVGTQSKARKQSEQGWAPSEAKGKGGQSTGEGRTEEGQEGQSKERGQAEQVRGGREARQSASRGIYAARQSACRGIRTASHTAARQRHESRGLSRAR